MNSWKRDHISQRRYQNTEHEDNTILNTILIQDNSRKNLIDTRGTEQENNQLTQEGRRIN